MMRISLLMAAFIRAAPAFAQSAGTAAVDPQMAHAPTAQAAETNCPPEHAAMGHCTPAAGTTQTHSPAAPVDPKCPPEHAAMGHCKPEPSARDDKMASVKEPPRAGPSPAALSGPEFAADGVWGAQAMAPVRASVYAEHGGIIASKLLLDRLEYRAQNGRDGYAWGGEAWFGSDYDRLWLKSQGEGRVGASPVAAEVQALWSHALDPWFNLQAGVRYDVRPKPSRAHLAIGVQGLARYWFEIDVAVFLSDHGELTARAEAEYDQRITNRLILQPRIEMNVAAQDIPATRVGSGLSTLEAGLRLRYEIVPEFAPYLGVVYERNMGKTADFARAAGEGQGGLSFVSGLRVWF